MTPDEIRAKVLAALAAVVPELDPNELRPDRPLRDELDIDSMDFLRVVVDLHARRGVDVPEKDYPKIRTLASSVDYLVARAVPAPA